MKRGPRNSTSAPVASKVFQQKFNEGPNGGLMKEPRRVNGPFRVNKREFFKTTRQLFHSLKTKTKGHVIGTVSARWLWSIGRYDVRKVASSRHENRGDRTRCCTVWCESSRDFPENQLSVVVLGTMDRFSWKVPYIYLSIKKKKKSLLRIWGKKSVDCTLVFIRHTNTSQPPFFLFSRRISPLRNFKCAGYSIAFLPVSSRFRSSSISVVIVSFFSPSVQSSISSSWSFFKFASLRWRVRSPPCSFFPGWWVWQKLTFVVLFIFKCFRLNANLTLVSVNQTFYLAW